MGASILPATIYKNKVYFLFGKERAIDDTPGWSDFGGGRDNNESYLDTAIREGGEEMTGFLGDMKPFLKTHLKFHYAKYDYTTLIFFLEYDPHLPRYFNNFQNFLQNKLEPAFIKKSKLFEKSEMKWFSIDEMKTKKGLFRSFYREIVDELYNKRIEIKQFLKEYKTKKVGKLTKKNTPVL